MTDLETWINDNKDIIFRIARYKRIFTPYEQEKKFIDEDIFEEMYNGTITKAIETNNEVILEIEVWYEDTDFEMKRSKITNYELLSNIQISKIEDEEDQDGV